MRSEDRDDGHGTEVIDFARDQPRWASPKTGQQAHVEEDEQEGEHTYQEV